VFPFLVFLLTSGFWLPLLQDHTLFNPVESQLVVGLTSGFLAFCNLAGKDAS
jgi:hypothetical protein